MTTRKVWRIEPVTLADAPAIARNNQSAFWQDLVWRSSWNDDITLQYLINQQSNKVPSDLLHRRDILRHMKAVDPDSGELLGYLRVALPAEHANDDQGQPVWPELQVPDVPLEERSRIEKIADETWYKPREDHSEDRAFEIQKEILSQGIYIRLRYVAVHPDHQRRGVCRALVKAVIDKADGLGVDVYLMAYEAGLPLYESLGFKVIKTNFEHGKANLKDGEHAVYFMIYSVKS